MKIYIELNEQTIKELIAEYIGEQIGKKCSSGACSRRSEIKTKL